MSRKTSKPSVMVFSGLDSTGGAGIQADIEAIASMGSHALPIITATTVQNTANLIESVPQDTDLLLKQASIVLEDMPVAAFKLGFLASAEIAIAINEILVKHPEIPVILDPVLKAGGGALMADDDLIHIIRYQLLARTTIVTPNSEEARLLGAAADTLDACAMSILDSDVEYVLITGEHDDNDKVINTLYGNHRVLSRTSWQRLSGQFHGSGCTLAASIAALLAQKIDLISSVYKAQEYTWKSLQHGYQAGSGQQLPDRLFWI